MNDELINLTVRTRDRIVYSGSVKSFSSVNDTGKFDVLPQHANFISLIKDELVIRDDKGKVEKIPLSGGILRVERNVAEVFLGIEK